MELNFTSLVEGKELKEWRSRRDFEQYLMEKQRWEVIGYVTHKTLNKWGEVEDWRGWESDENMYVLQKGKEYYFLAFRNGSWIFIMLMFI